MKEDLLDFKSEMVNGEGKLKEELDSKSNIHVPTAVLSESKLKEQNRIRQLAFKARAKMPKDYNLFYKVAAHLFKNAHRYYKEDKRAPHDDDFRKKCEERRGM